MGGNYNFKKDLPLGQEGENEILAFLKEKGGEFVCFGHTNEFDIKMKFNGKIYSYEVKTDVYAKDTGNILIEYFAWGKPSGISVTKADYYLTYFKNSGEIWNIRTDVLKWLMKHFSHKKTGGGDKGSGMKAYLINKEVFKSFFRIHKI